MPEPKLLDERSVRRQITSLEIGEQPASGADHLQQAPSAVMVLQMGAEVLGQGVDPLGKQCHLHLGGTGVAGMGLVLGYHCLLVKAHVAGVLFMVSRVVIRCSTGK